MPADCSCHGAEVPYKNVRAGHQPPSPPLAPQPSWGGRHASCHRASIHLGTDTCPGVCARHLPKTAASLEERRSQTQALRIQRQAQTSAVELIPKPDMKLHSQHYAYDICKNAFMLWQHIQKPVKFCLHWRFIHISTGILFNWSPVCCISLFCEYTKKSKSIQGFSWEVSDFCGSVVPKIFCLIQSNLLTCDPSSLVMSTSCEKLNGGVIYPYLLLLFLCSISLYFKGEKENIWSKQKINKCSFVEERFIFQLQCCGPAP